MKSTIILSFIGICLFGFTQQMEAQNINNSVTIEAKVLGNCGMCKKTIEKAANKKSEALVIWDKNKLVATITYDSKKTNVNEVLKRIADAGYDNEKFKAPDDVYNKLHGCCQYDRVEVVNNTPEKNN